MTILKYFLYLTTTLGALAMGSPYLEGPPLIKPHRLWKKYQCGATTTEENRPPPNPQMRAEFFNLLEIKGFDTTITDNPKDLKKALTSLGRRDLQGGLIKTEARKIKSFHRVVMDAFPELNIKIWDFKAVPNGYWHSPCHQLEFLTYVLGARKVTANPAFPPTHWRYYENIYSLSNQDFEDSGGAGLISSHFNGSYIEFITSLLPEAPMHSWLFSYVPNGYWDSMPNQLAHFQWMLNELDIAPDTSYPEGHWLRYKKFYTLREDTVRNLGARPVINRYYDGSLFAYLDAMMGGPVLMPWLMGRVPNGYWNSPHNIILFFKYLTQAEPGLKPTDVAKMSYDDRMDFFNRHRAKSLFVNTFNGDIIAFAGTFAHFLETGTLFDIPVES